MSKWYLQSGVDSDCVISTRVRLARNLTDFPFPDHMTVEQKREVSRQVHDALMQSNSPIAKEFDFLDMEQCPPAQAVSMVERHLVSPEFIRDCEGRALLMTHDESVSIMLCEEDHLRIQVMKPGLDLKGAFELADRIDSLLDERLSYAFDDRLGYLTQCPTNLGTGMRASVMLHLPALQERGAIGQLANTVSKLGLTIRGFYGEGSDPQGALYQLSNQVTLGISESAALQNLHGIAQQVITQERTARKALVADPRVEDRIFRSYGVLSTARLLSSQELMTLLSNVRLGIAEKLLCSISLDTIAELMIEGQPGNLTVLAKEDLSPDQRDAFRAKFVREHLPH